MRTLSKGSDSEAHAAVAALSATGSAVGAVSVSRLPGQAGEHGALALHVHALVVATALVLAALIVPGAAAAPVDALSAALAGHLASSTVLRRAELRFAAIRRVAIAVAPTRIARALHTAA